MLIKFLPFWVLSLSLLTGCGEKPNPEETLISIQVIDRNGFSETVSAKDRLTRYQKVNFCDPQPYQKVLRVFGKSEEGKSSSTITSYHSNGHISQYLEVVDGRAHGLYREWYPNGHLRMELKVIEGIADVSEAAFASWVFEGENNIWDEQGYLLAKIFYEKGMLHGNSLYYYPNGQIKKHIVYFQNKVEGCIYCYTESGEILETVSYQDNKPHGLAQLRLNNGTLLYEEEWKEGVLLTGTYYQIDGTILSKISEGKGQRACYEEGKLTRLVEYKEGKAEGLITCFDSKGIISHTYEQKEGKKNGEEKIYYPSSSNVPNQVKVLLNWQEDVLQGTVKTWFSDGMQESQKELYQNKKNGPALAWYKNGSLMLIEEYENDVLISGSYYKKGDKKPVSKIVNKKGTATLYDPDGHFLRKIPYEKGLPVLDGENES